MNPTYLKYELIRSGPQQAWLHHLARVSARFFSI